MLVRIARGPAILWKERIIFAVGYDTCGQLAVEFEPLGTFSPFRELDERSHAAVVAAFALFGVVKEGVDKAVGRAY